MTAKKTPVKTPVKKAEPAAPEPEAEVEFAPSAKLVEEVNEVPDVEAVKAASPAVFYAENGLRGSGRTYRQIAALPDGAFFVVANWGMRDHVADVLDAQGRAPDAIKVVALSQMDAVTGHRVPVDMDHDARDKASAEQMAQYRSFRGAVA